MYILELCNISLVIKKMNKQNMIFSCSKNITISKKSEFPSN